MISYILSSLLFAFAFHTAAAYLRSSLSSTSRRASASAQGPLANNIKDWDGENIDLNKSINFGLGTEKLLYVDMDIIVVDKPSNAQTAPGYLDKDSLATRIAALFHIERVDRMIVHRLDYATSGVLVFARNDAALRDLHAQFRKVHAPKVYNTT